MIKFSFAILLAAPRLFYRDNPVNNTGVISYLRSPLPDPAATNICICGGVMRQKFGDMI